jgi:hypothetical protein
MRPPRLLAPAAAALAACAVAACAPRARRAAPDRYDVVVTNARVVDGTGNPWFWGDVALRGDRVARVAPRGVLAGAPARERVDARGQVVAPGFIDVQSHSWDALLVGDGRVVGKVAQGVTTEILGEATTPAPTNDAVLALIEGERTDSALRALHRRFGGRRGFGAWLDALGRHPRSVNVGSYLGATTVRAYAMGRRAGAAGPAEVDTMRRVVADAMRDGAVGLATALIYPPGSYATTASSRRWWARCAGAARTSRTCGRRAGACSRPPTRRWPIARGGAGAARHLPPQGHGPLQLAQGARARRQDRFARAAGWTSPRRCTPTRRAATTSRAASSPTGPRRTGGCWTTSATPPRAGACSPR